MTKWEYFVWESPLPITVEELKELGAEGWELVGLIRFTPKLYQVEYAYYFKRSVREGGDDNHLA